MKLYLLKNLKCMINIYINKYLLVLMFNCGHKVKFIKINSGFLV